MVLSMSGTFKGSVKTNTIVGRVNVHIPPPPPGTTTTTTRHGGTYTKPPYLPGFPGGVVPHTQSTTQGFGVGLLDEIVLALASLGLIVPLMDTFASVENNVYTPQLPSANKPVTYANGSFYILLPDHKVVALPLNVVEQLAYYIQQNPDILKGNNP